MFGRFDRRPAAIRLLGLKVEEKKWLLLLNVDLLPITMQQHIEKVILKWTPMGSANRLYKENCVSSHHETIFSLDVDWTPQIIG